MEGVQSPVAKFLTAETVEAILERTDAQTGDIIFFGAGAKGTVTDAMGALRLKTGRDLNLDRPEQLASAVGDRLPDV
ncbi:Aspartate--tRNA ligase [Morganella morganii]|nr:Aspartate--tRNA ligase [Morganella morganii]